MIPRAAAILALLVCLAGCSKKPEALSYRVISTLPHDASCYTQGLEFHGRRLFESGGGYGTSTIRELDPQSGVILRKRPMSDKVFAEGITILNNELFVLTWKEHTVLVLEPDSFRPVRSHQYQGEGWGLTHNGSELIMSNGSSKLAFIDPATFQTKRTLTVTDGSREIDMLNELEVIDGAIFANIYLKDRIARIDPDTGKVTGWLDLSNLRGLLPAPHQAEVLNGIARMPDSRHLLVTGKFWPRMFVIDVTNGM